MFLGVGGMELTAENSETTVPWGPTRTPAIFSGTTVLDCTNFKITLAIYESYL